MTKHSTRTTDAELRALPEVATLRLDQRERRQRIIDAAERLMVDVDYEKIQVKDVADEADVALGTLYRYFNSKDHLFACALQSWSQRFGDAPGRWPRPGPPRTGSRPIYRRAARAFERQPRVYDVRHADPEQQGPARGTGLARLRPPAERGLRPGPRDAHGSPTTSRRDVTAVMSAVLDENLRSWQLGLHAAERASTSRSTGRPS